MLSTYSPHWPKLKLVTAHMLALPFFMLALMVTLTPVFAASCTYPTFSVYPGSAFPPYVRYGQVDFHFESCSDQSPSSWTASVTKQQVNSTGKNLGFFIDSASIKTVGSGSYYKDFDGEIDASSCLPRVGWPCYSSYSLKVGYRVTLDRFQNPQVYQGETSAPIGMALYDRASGSASLLNVDADRWRTSLVPIKTGVTEVPEPLSPVMVISGLASLFGLWSWGRRSRENRKSLAILTVLKT